MLSRVFLATVSVAFMTSHARAESPNGEWARDDGNTRVRIAQCGDNICATNTWVRNPGAEQVGHVLVLKVKKEGANLWKGSAYDPQRELTVSMEMNVGPQEMKTSGCVLGGLLCRSTKWTRLK